MNAARVLSKGFEVGDLVERKVDGKRGKITEITADHVRFVAEDSCSDEFQVSSESFVRDEWKKVAAKKVVTMLTQWHLSAGTNSREFEISILKAKVLQAMADQHEHLAVNYNAIDICKQPRDVKFAVRELQLPITSCKIHVVEETHATASSSITVGTCEVQGCSTRVDIHGFTVWPQEGDNAGGFLSPVWIMRTSTVRADANMEIHNLKPKDPCCLAFVRNFRKIQAGASLILYRPAKQEAPEELQPVPISKKPRTQ